MGKFKTGVLRNSPLLPGKVSGEYQVETEV
jgi:hypothetical protein